MSQKIIFNSTALLLGCCQNQALIRKNGAGSRACKTQDARLAKAAMEIAAAMKCAVNSESQPADSGSDKLNTLFPTP